MLLISGGQQAKRWFVGRALLISKSEAKLENTRLIIFFLSFLFLGAAIAGVYKAAGKTMISLEALVFGVGQSFCVLLISFLRILATL